MKVIILGSGPAGLMAAQGVKDACADAGEGLEIGILSRKVKSSLYGAQYLHEPIRGFTPARPVMVRYQLRGDVDDYRRKVYGQKWDGTTSPEDLAGEHPAWDIRETYHALWAFWSAYVFDTEVDPVGLRNIVSDGQEESTQLILNSIPRPAICYSEEHNFTHTQIIAAGDAPDLGIKIPFSCPENTVVCNGDDNPSWYRMSRVFGHTTVEWPGSIQRVPITSAATVKKPLSTNCDCWGADIQHVGRYGKWQKGVLSHEAWREGHDAVRAILGRV